MEKITTVILDALKALASSTMQTITLKVEKNKVHSFDVSGFPKDAKSFLIFLVKDYCSGGSKLENLFSWFAGSAYAVRARSLNPETKTVKVDGKEQTIKNPDFKQVYPFAHAFTTFVTPDKFKKIKLDAIAKLEQEKQSKTEMFNGMRQFLDGENLKKAESAFNEQIEKIDAEIKQNQADIKELDKK